MIPLLVMVGVNLLLTAILFVIDRKFNGSIEPIFYAIVLLTGIILVPMLVVVVPFMYIGEALHKLAQGKPMR